MKKLLLAALLAFSPMLAFAADAVLSWTPPTQNTDGTSLTNLAGYRVYYGTTAASLTQTVTIANAGTSTYTITGLNTGTTYYFAVRAYTSTGSESANSNVVSKVIAAPVPNPPTGLRVADLVVYQVTGTANQFTLLPVGTVPASTPCISEQSVNGHNAVDRSVVTWYGSVRPQVVVARCSG